MALDPNRQAQDLNHKGWAAWTNDDGSIVIYDIHPPHDTVATIPPGGEGVIDLPDGTQAVRGGDGNVSVRQAPAAAPQPAPGSASEAPGAAPGPSGALGAQGAAPPQGGRQSSRAAGLVAQPTVGAGRYPQASGGQTVRAGATPFGQTVAPGTWNPADPSQGRGEGWGSIGAGTEGIQYGYGVPGFGQAPIKINERDLPHLYNPKVAPGYIPGSGTYNQYRLDQGGLFGTVKGSGSPEVVNLRYGLGGTGDPTTGGEIQTPERWITGNPGASTTALQGDLDWRKRYGGGAAAPGGTIDVDPASVSVRPAGASWAARDAGVRPGGTGGGMGGGFFAAGPGYSPSEMGGLWGQTPQTQGLDYLITLFMRSDTPTGISTAAWSAPKAYWDGLADAIRRGIVRVADPQAWQMLGEKGYSQQSIGGAALTGGQAGGTTGGTSGGTQGGVVSGVAGGTLGEGAQTPFGPIVGGLPQGFDEVWHRLLLDMQNAASDRAVNEARLTGRFNGLPTLDAQRLEAEIRTMAAQQEIARLAENRQQQEMLYQEAYRQATLKQNQQKLDADIKNAEEQIKVKREEIASIAATGDKDREQRERENLREMEFNLSKLKQDAEIATGFISGRATVEMQRLIAEQQQQAYQRAANPAMAFENELARGLTGWNAPGVSPGAVGVPGVTLPGQTMQQFMAAGGWAQPGLPGVPQQMLPGGAPQAGAPQQDGAMYLGGSPTFNESTGTYMTPEQMQQYSQQQAAQRQATLGAQAPNLERMPTLVDDTGWTAEQRAAWEQQQQQAAQQAYQQRTGALQQQGVYQAAQPGTGGVPTGWPAIPEPTGGASQMWAQGGQQPSLAAGLVGGAYAGVPIRTPAAVSAFKGGWAMPTAGSYGVSGGTQPFAQAAITPDQVRLQNLKQTRGMAPDVRGIVQSFAGAGGTNKQTFDYFTDQGAPGASTAGASYSMR
jgi:hypothetical protein